MKMNVFFDKVCHINNFFRLLLKNSSIALLPDIPPKIHHEGYIFGAVPLIQLECQKLVLSPLPTVTIVEALKRSLSVASQGLSRLAQGLSSFFHLYQYQRSRKALASRSRSRTPSPPRSLGVHTVGQFTRQ